MKASAFFAIPANVVGTSPVELATPALLKMITSRSLASPSSHRRIPVVQVPGEVLVEDKRDVDRYTGCAVAPAPVREANPVAASTNWVGAVLCVSSYP